LIVVYDRLAARQASSFQYWLHAVNQFAVDSQDDIRLQVGEAACNIRILEPQGMLFSQTNQYDPNPRERIKLREWHLTGKTKDKTTSVEFIAVIRPYRKTQQPPHEVKLDHVPGGYSLSVKLSDGSVAMLLPSDDAVELSVGRLKTTGEVAVQLYAADGSVVETAKPSR
jgi:hypothetical protein